MTPRDSVVAAAFELFAEHGYEQTSVEDIATAAGVSRSRFFRLFGAKENVIFPDHDALLARVDARLAASTAESAIAGVSDAVRLVLFHYIGEGGRARARYQLTSSVPSLRERELVSSARYQRLFRRYISAWGDGTPDIEMRAELMSAAVVAAHNRVLRRWLRGEIEDPHAEIDYAMDQVHELFAEKQSARAVIVVQTSRDLPWVAEQIRQL